MAKSNKGSADIYDDLKWFQENPDFRKKATVWYVFEFVDEVCPGIEVWQVFHVKNNEIELDINKHKHKSMVCFTGQVKRGMYGVPSLTRV